MLDTGEIFTSLASIATLEAVSVANIDSPTELNSAVGSVVGERRVCYQTVANDNIYTVYYFDSADGSGASSPYVLAASGSGYWIATAGKYVNSAVKLRSTLDVAGACVVQGIGGIGSTATSSGSVLIVGSNNATGSLLAAASQSAINADMRGTTAATTMTRCYKGNTTVNNYTSASSVVYWADNVVLAGSGVVTRNYGFVSRRQTAGTNNFAVFVGDESSTTATGTWSLYVDTTDPAFLGGALTVTGTSTLAAVNATSIGATTAGTGKFTTLQATGTTTAVAINASGTITVTTASFPAVNLTNTTPGTTWSFNQDNSGNFHFTEAAVSDWLTLAKTTGLATFAGSVTVASGKAYQVNGTQVVAARDTGWTAMTGSPDKATAYATGTVTLAQLAGRVAQIQASLTTHGLFGA